MKSWDRKTFIVESKMNRILFAIATLSATAVVAQTPPIQLNDGERHGDPLYMLEEGWRPLPRRDARQHGRTGGAEIVQWKQIAGRDSFIGKPRNCAKTMNLLHCLYNVR
jgi:hypothetical protein